MWKLLVAILSCLTATASVLAQSTIGLPAIRNYQNTDYHASIENWDIGQDKRGVLYFANNDGLLTFDGTYWKVYPLPNKAAIKSLAIDTAGRIYVGGHDEVGYFYPDRDGILIYHSLKDKLPRIAQQFADVWNIVLWGNAVYFRTVESMFELKGGNMQTFDAPGGWQLMTRVDSELLAEDKTKGLFAFRAGQWREICPAAAAFHVTGILPYKKDSLLVTTLKNGLYLLTPSGLVRKPTAADLLLTNDLINSARKIGADRYALGTATGGVLILDGDGRVIQRFSSEEGLQNNNILSVLPDEDSNLWLGLDNGISFIHYNTSVKLIRPVKDNQLISNAVKIYNQHLYIGTSNGLYTIPLDASIPDISALKGNFSEVANTKGQVWSLEEINHELLMGHQDGGFVIRDNRAMPVLTQQGVWGFKSVGWNWSRAGNGGGVGQDLLGIIAGSYTGLRWVFENKKGEFSEGGRMNDLYESLPAIAVQGATVWASHPYRGVFSNPIPMEGNFGHWPYDKKKGLPSDMNNYVAIIHNKVVAATEKGIYEYDPASDLFRPAAFFSGIFHDSSVEYLTEDKEGNIWFVSNQRVGLIDFSKGGRDEHYSVIYFPELTGQTVQGSAYIYPYNRENVFIGSNNGVFHLNLSQYIRSANKISVLLGTVKAIAEKDSLIFGGFADCGETDVRGGSATTGETAVRLPNHWNSFHFEYSSPSYALQNDV
jgi:ligand-binding sensor domain-containing protein